MASKPSEPTAFIDELRRRIWITKGARFNAYNRLKAMHEWSLRSIAFLSAYLIALTLAPYVPVFALTPHQKDAIAFCSIVLAIFILVLSLLESSKNYQLASERLHQCAQELSDLYNDVERIALAPTRSAGDKDAEAGELSHRYAEVVRRYHENHEHVDDQKFRAQYADQFDWGMLRVAWAHAQAWFRTYGPFVLLIMGLPLASLLFILNAW